MAQKQNSMQIALDRAEASLGREGRSRTPPSEPITDSEAVREKDRKMAVMAQTQKVPKMKKSKSMTKKMRTAKQRKDNS